MNAYENMATCDASCSRGWQTYSEGIFYIRQVMWIGDPLTSVWKSLLVGVDEYIPGEFGT
jgi:hypothetical protein